ncbi:glycosyltransferase [Shewanella pneumatophori]|uniref:Glycosyltransferase n=1 Tax=Shewanella pneumatophori TaxID=314092 RepID=A0A9X2CD70_9GAMM|nr:glycosyltransferase [Shewanella pneumatophori]MCL1137642.1 glycosyltransferase [Shewanella pneumatophori]
MRPTIVHLIDDTKLGGVNLALESLAASALQQSFSFKLLYRQFNSCSFQRYQADVIVLHAAASWRKLPAFLALKLANIGTPILYQEHHYSREFVRHCVQSSTRFEFMLQLTYKLMHKVLLVSQSQQEWLTELDVIAADKMVLVGQGKELSAFIALPSKVDAESLSKSIAKEITPEPVEVSTQAPALATAQSHKPPIKLLAYGRLSKQKGFDLLIKAMAKLPAEQVQLSIAGDGEQREELVQLAKGLSHVELVGEVQDVPRFLAQGDLVVIPSRWEPFGLTCIEAVAAGKPVIVANLDGLADQAEALRCHSLSPSLTFTPSLSCQLKELQVVKLLDELSVTGIEQAILQVINGEPLQVSSEQRVYCERVWESVLDSWKQLLQQVVATHK